MPLLNKEPFKKDPIPNGLVTSDEVFHCKLTNEIFTDYEKFFSRVILCNSMVWSCELSGRSGLTYEDAYTSEIKLIQEIKSIPICLLNPILYIASLTQRQKFLDLVEDVYNFVKDRYFVGEQVEVFVGELMSKKVCEVLKVLKLNEPVKKLSINLDDSDGSDVICLDDPPPPSSSKTNHSSKTNEYIEARFYEYIIQDIKNSSSISTVPVEKIIRRKFLLARQKCKIILKHYCCQNKEDIWIINTNKLNNIKIESLSFESMFVGPIPKFIKSDVKRKPSFSSSLNGTVSKVKSNNNSANKNKILKKKKIENHDSKQTSIKQHMNISEKNPAISKKEKVNSEAEMKKAFEEAKLRAIERDKKKISAQELKKLKHQEENKKRKEAEQRDRERNLPRDDLLCDNLKDLPQSTKLDCLLPSHLFAKTIVIIEFINEFRSLLDLALPKNLTFEIFSKGLITSEVDGLFSKVLLELLSSLMRVQDQELEPETLDDSDKKIETLIDDKLEKFNIFAQTASSLYFTTLRKLSFDVLTMTEILRLHLISFIGTSSNSKHDYQQRGGYTTADDPGSIFIEKHQDIIKKLSIISVYECSEEEKVDILDVLISQLLTYAVCRDYIEEKLEKLKEAKKNLRIHQLAIGKRKKDELLYWQKKKQEDKVKINDNTTSTIPERRSKHLSDKDFENLPSENLDWEKITEDEKSQMHAWEKRKEQALLFEALSLQPSIFSLGMDRSYRRYWFFKSIPGLFVEDGGEDLAEGTSLNLIPQHSPKKTPLKSNSINAFNSSINIPSKEIVEKNINVMKMISVKEQLANRGKCIWSFYYSIEQLAALIDGFNTRGVREINLKKYIVERESFIVESMLNSDFTFFNQNEALPTGPVKSRATKTKSSASESVTRYTSASEAMEAIVKDTLLDIEERIYDGTLGSMKDIDRLVWRDELTNGNYKKIISYEFEMEDFCNNTCSLPIVGLKAALIQIAKMVETRYLSPPLIFDKNKKQKIKDKKKKKEDENNSDNESVSSGPIYQSPFDLWVICILSPLVKSFSQIATHASVLESSIAWSKCILHSKCRICRRKGDAAMLLLCDGCDRGHHTYCLDPPVKIIPEGDWFCPVCRPKEVLPRTPRKNYQEVSNTQDNSEDDEDVDDRNDKQESDEEDEETDEDEQNDDNTDQNEEDSEHENCVIDNGHDSSSSNGETENDSQNSDEDDDDAPTDNDDDEDQSDDYEAVNKRRSSKKAKISFAKKTSKPVALSRLTRSRTNVESFNKPKELRRRSELISRKRKNDFEEPNGKRREIGRSEDEEMKLVDKLIGELITRDEAWPFLKPVSKKEAPDYLDIIKTPMDFSKIKTKILNFEYTNATDMLQDIRLIFSNCMEYNMPVVPQYTASEKLSRYFERRVRELKLNSPIKKSDSVKQNYRRRL